MHKLVEFRNQISVPMIFSFHDQPQCVSGTFDVLWKGPHKEFPEVDKISRAGLVVSRERLHREKVHEGGDWNRETASRWKNLRALNNLRFDA